MIETLLRRPVSVLVGTVALSALGVFSLLKLPLSLLPSVERPKLVIVARAAAASGEEMLHDVTTPIERRLSSVPGISSIESRTIDGESRIELGSAWQTDPDRLRIDVARRIEGAPERALDELAIDVAGSDVTPVIEVAVAGASGAARSRIAERVVLPELARLAGAGKIDVIGATPLRVVVTPRAAALAARGLTALDVEERLRTAGNAAAAGRVREGAAMRYVVVAQPVRSLAELRALLVRDVPLGEVADVELREVPSRSSAGVGTGSAVVLLRIHRAPNANAVALARDVRERVSELAARVRDVRIEVVADRSREVTRALIELALAAFAGVLLGMLVLRYMLGVWRPTFALAVVVPAALLASFCAFYFAGVPLDVISLAGLALATGLLVDNSIVVLESIETARARGGAGDPVAIGTRQILTAVVASSITLMIVFAPLLYLRGLARALFGEQAIAVVASVAASLVLSLTLTPVLAQRDATPTRPRSPGLAGYLRLLERVSANPRPAFVIAIVVMLAAFASAALLPRELFARGAERRVLVELELGPDLHPALARAASERVFNAVRGAVGDHAETMLLTQEEGEGTIELTFRTPRAARAAVPRLRDAVATIAGARATVRLLPSTFIEAVGGDATRIELVASAATPREAEALAQRVNAKLRERGFHPLVDRLDQTRGALELRWDESLLARNGIDRRGVEQQVRAALGGIDTGQVDIPGAEPAILLEATKPSSLAVVPVRTADRVLPLASVGTARFIERTPVAYHDQSRPARRLEYSASGSASVDAALRAVNPRGSERVRVAGHQRELADAFGQMTLAFVLAFILLYLTVAAFYESLLLPLLVMTALPFAAAGAIVLLLVTGQSLNVMSLIGLVFLGGVVVNHTLVLIDRAEQLRAAGEDEETAIRAAAAERYRPVLMTTLTAILGMLPLALIGGDGVELRRAVAIAVTGGLITATIGTLVLVPLLHRAVEPFRTRRAAAVGVPEPENA